jgi:hypothetical protein
VPGAGGFACYFLAGYGSLQRHLGSLPIYLGAAGFCEALLGAFGCFLGAGRIDFFGAFAYFGQDDYSICENFRETFYYRQIVHLAGLNVTHHANSQLGDQRSVAG